MGVRWASTHKFHSRLRLGPASRLLCSVVHTAVLIAVLLWARSAAQVAIILTRSGGKLPQYIWG